MPKSRYRFMENDLVPYLITATTVNWLLLFGNPKIAQILLDSFKFLIHQIRLTVYVYGNPLITTRYSSARDYAGIQGLVPEMMAR